MTSHTKRAALAAAAALILLAGGALVAVTQVQRAMGASDGTFVVVVRDEGGRAVTGAAVTVRYLASGTPEPSNIEARGLTNAAGEASLDARATPVQTPDLEVTRAGAPHPSPIVRSAWTTPPQGSVRMRAEVVLAGPR